mgnify:CR=1 FL=1
MVSVGECSSLRSIENGECDFDFEGGSSDEYVPESIETSEEGKFCIELLKILVAVKTSMNPT